MKKSAKRPKNKKQVLNNPTPEQELRIEKLKQVEKCARLQRRYEQIYMQIENNPILSAEQKSNLIEQQKKNYALSEALLLKS